MNDVTDQQDTTALTMEAIDEGLVARDLSTPSRRSDGGARRPFPRRATNSGSASSQSAMIRDQHPDTGGAASARPMKLAESLSEWQERQAVVVALL